MDQLSNDLDMVMTEIVALGSAVATAGNEGAQMVPSFVHWAEGVEPGRRDAGGDFAEASGTAQGAILGTVVNMEALAELGDNKKNYSAMVLAEDIEAALRPKEDKKDTDLNSVAAVSKRNQAIKSIEAQCRRTVDALHAAAQESQSIESFFKEKVSEEEKATEPWKGLYAKLRAAVDNAAT